MRRRKFLHLSAGTLAARYLAPFAAGARKDKPDTFLARLRHGPGRILPVGTEEIAGKVTLSRQWDGDFCRAKIVNHGKQAVRIQGVVICEAAHDLPDQTLLYGDSFQMLSQTSGTLGHPQDLGYSELRHYKIPQPQNADAFAVSGVVTLSPPASPSLVLGFASCRRFIGRFFLAKGSIQAVIDTEGLELAPGESWELEELMLAENHRRPELLAALGERIAKNHPRRLFQPVPTGWCSWYCFGPRV